MIKKTNTMLQYSSYRYIYPPRPDNALPASELVKYDNQQYIAQPKLNGDCMPIFTNGKELIIKDRHNKDFKKVFKALPDLKMLHRQSMSEAKGDSTSKWIGLVGEYMVKSKKNAEGKIWNDKYVLFDIVVFDGVQLLGTTFDERQLLLDKLYGTVEEAIIPDGVYRDPFLYATAVPNIFRVKNFRDCFTGLWEELIKIDMYEGLVLKKTDAKLENGLGEKNNAGSMVKFRKPTKNYAF